MKKFLSVVIASLLFAFSSEAAPPAPRTFTGTSVQKTEGNLTGNHAQIYTVTGKNSGPSSIAVFTSFSDTFNQTETFTFAKGKVTYDTASFNKQGTFTKSTKNGKTVITVKIKDSTRKNTFTFTLSKKKVKSNFVYKSFGFNGVFTTRVTCTAAPVA